MTLLSLVKLMHLVGLIMGLGGAMLADVLILKGAILKPIEDKTVVAVRTLSHIVFVGLGLLWVSGILLVAIRVNEDPNVWLNQKIWAKVTIVVILTINGLVVHYVALDRLSSRLSQKLFSGRRPYELIGLSLVAAISSVSWFTPFVLGVATEFNYTVTAITILSIYTILVMLGWITFSSIAFISRDSDASQGKLRRTSKYASVHDAAIGEQRARPGNGMDQLRSEILSFRRELQHHENRWLSCQKDFQQFAENCDRALDKWKSSSQPVVWKKMVPQSPQLQPTFSGSSQIETERDEMPSNYRVRILLSPKVA